MSSQVAGHVQHQGINDRWLWRAITILALRLYGTFRLRHGPVIFLSRDVCVKYGRSVHLIEAHTIEFVRRSTTIPVPKIYCAFVRHGTCYIVMQRLRGNPLAWTWTTRGTESRKIILKQLRDITRQLRDIPQKPNGNKAIANVNGGAIYDGRLPTRDTHGPFNDVQSFHRYLRADICSGPETSPEVLKLIQMNDDTGDEVCFTHADLSSFNILACDNTITGVIDWDTAGWLPKYWEYVSAWNVSPHNLFWQAEVKNFLDPFPRELEMDTLRRKWFGDY